MRDKLKQIVEEVQNTVPKKRIVKANRTLSLDVDNFKRLQDHCRDNQVTVSEVIDKLIAAYMDEVMRS